MDCMKPGERVPPGSLRAALAYENDEVVKKFQVSYDLPTRQANELFVEAKRWVWLIARGMYLGFRRKDFFVTHHLAAMDEMWHTFVLYTSEYHRFCERYLKTFVHHVPTTRAEKERLLSLGKRRPDALAREQDRRWRRLIGVIRSELGDETIHRWYVQFPERYSLPYLDEHRRRFGGAYQLE